MKKLLLIALLFSQTFAESEFYPKQRIAALGIGLPQAPFMVGAIDVKPKELNWFFDIDLGFSAPNENNTYDRSVKWAE